MPMFYFDHLEDGWNVLTDLQGVRLKDADAARIEASRALGELARDVLATAGPRLTLEIRVRNESSKPILAAVLHFEARPLVEGL